MFSFRETAAVITVAMVLWYVLVLARRCWADHETAGRASVVAVALAAAVSAIGISTSSRAPLWADADALTEGGSTQSSPSSRT